MSPGCDFCAIVAGEQQADVVLRTESVIAFFPLEPATLGHTLVVPTQHVPDIWSVDDETARRLASITRQVAFAARAAFAPAGLNVIQSNGAVATQTVPHLHVHVVPRYREGDLGPIWPEQQGPTALDVAEAAQRLRDSLGVDGGGAA